MKRQANKIGDDKLEVMNQRSPQVARSLHRSVHPLHQLQPLGNRALGRLIRMKLNVNQAGDAYEQDADRGAEQVTRIPERPAVDQLKLHADGGPGPSAKEAAPVAAQINSLSDSGEPLPESTRAYFEPRFGLDFSQVRIHQDRQAAESARQVNALAYTSGHDIVFGAGQFAPETSTGRSLLAHELAHVRQNLVDPTPQLVKRYEGPEHQDLAAAHLQSLLQFLQTEEGERWARSMGMDRRDLVTSIMQDIYTVGAVIEPPPEGTTRPEGERPMRLTPAQIISLMGDFYGSPEALARAPASETGRILSVMNQERLGTISESAAALQYEETTGGRYLRLAARNDTHFARLNKQEWRRLHEQGIAESRRATGPEAETRFQWALFLDAASGHFLTDAYAAGHLFAKDELLTAITLHLRAQPVTVENPAMATYAWAIDFKGRMPQLVLKNIHDRMNREGFDVTNGRGMRWRTFGDNHLALAQETQRIAALAVFLSRQQIINVRGSATAVADSAEVEALMPNDDTVVSATQQAIAYIPDAAREVENLIYRNRSLAPAQFGSFFGAIIESNISTIGHPGRQRELLDMLESARRIGVDAPIAPSFTLGTF